MQLEIFEECGDGGSRYIGGFNQGAGGVGHAIDTAMLVVAIGIAGVVLHVTDDYVLPVRYVKGSIVSDLDIGGSEVSVLGGDEKVVDRGTLAVSVTIVGKCVLLDSEESDRVANQEVSIVGLGEVGA